MMTNWAQTLRLLLLLAILGPSARAQSAPTDTPLAIVSIHASQARTSEPLPYALVLPGKFVVSRVGDRSEALRVFLEYQGTAGPQDYEPLPESVVIPAGAESTSFLLFAKADDLVEGSEYVVAKIRPSTAIPDHPEAYRIDLSREQARVEIADEDRAGEPTVISIASDPAETAEPGPTIRVIPGAFVVKRSGPVDQPLTVFLEFAGTATPGRDYQELPESVTFTAGSSTVKLQVFAIDDDLLEQDEKVVAEVVPTPLSSGRPYNIDLEARRAVVTIHDSDHFPGIASLTITRPEPGAVFKRGTTIEIEALAVDPNGYIPRVEFYSDERLIAVSEIAFFQAPENGTPVVHSIEYTNAPAGTHALTVRAVDSLGNPLRSEPVRIVVEGAGPSIVITSPQEGARVPAGEPLEIRAVAVDPESYIPRVEFYAGRTLLGVSQIFFIVAPPSGEPIHHEFVWTDPLFGEHILTAKAHSASGEVVSRAVRISAERKGSGDGQVVLAIEAIDPLAHESGADPATFRIKRVAGRRDIPVTAHLAIGGTAENGADYLEIPREVVIPASSDAVDLKIDPVPDKALEGRETVVLELRPPLCVKIFPPPDDCYLIAPDRGAARAEIREENGPDAENRPPRVAVVAPRHGAVIEPGTLLSIRAEAADADGQIARLELFADGESVAVSEKASIEFVWTNPPPGAHWLTAVAVDNDGATNSSATVKFLAGYGAGGTVLNEMTGIQRCERLSNGHVRLALEGKPNEVVNLEVSADLERWERVGKVFLPDGQLQFTDDSAGSNRTRFYRLAAE